jgi:hypothetical protein
MKWRMEFYNESQGIIESHDVDAQRPADAVRLGWEAVLADHPSIPPGSRMSSFERAQPVGSHEASGWVLYRIVNDAEHGSSVAAVTRAA